MDPTDCILTYPASVTSQVCLDLNILAKRAVLSYVYVLVLCSCHVIVFTIQLYNCNGVRVVISSTPTSRSWIDQENPTVVRISSRF